MNVYRGPERRDQPDIRDYLDHLIEQQTRHFDAQIADLRDKVDPMHDYFKTAKVNLSILKWLVGVGGGVVAAWHLVKEWFK